MSELLEPPVRRLGNVLVNHMGFTPGGKKRVIVRAARGGVFELRDMSLLLPAGLGEREGYGPVLTGGLRREDSPMGTYWVGDFSEWTVPGIYQVVLPGTGERSYHFAISDGAFGVLPGMFLGFVHNWRSGPYESALRARTHLDDARRSDNGVSEDVSGGWYDAGDMRKWMVHSNLPALAFMDAHDCLPWRYAEWERVEAGWSPWLLEALWGLDYLLKMQEPGTGMFYGDVGGGGDERKRPGMKWWYENHAGCYADNGGNYFTDNVAGSGDERSIRIQYNPVAQFTSVAILARAARTYAPLDGDRARRYGEAAERGWRLGLRPDPRYLDADGDDFTAWTAVRSWRCLAALELHRGGRLPWAEVEGAAVYLLEGFVPELGFWMNETGGSEPFRGILHSAQPLIALAGVARATSDTQLRARILGVLRQCLDRYVFPLAAVTPFGFVPFGVYTKAASDGDLYHPWRDGYLYRLFMPEHHVQRVNHGLGGHWTSWAHGLALVGALLEETRCFELAWTQLHWLTGANPFNSCLVSGAGYNNPMPHSRFFGTYPGGFCNGFNGSADDLPLLDLDGEARWNSTEYWMTPLCNMLMALSALNAAEKGPRHRIGERPNRESVSYRGPGARRG